MNKLIKTSILSLTLLLVQGCVAFSTDETFKGFTESSVITTSVKARLARTNGLDSLRISVSTYNGDILLSGFVPTQEQKDLAGKVANNTEGVTKVYNNIEVLQ